MDEADCGRAGPRWTRTSTGASANDEALRAALTASDAAGLPAQHVAANQGKPLHLLARAGSRRASRSSRAPRRRRWRASWRRLDPDGDASVQGVRRFAEMLAAQPRVAATAEQTVGEKRGDGFALALVVR